jgi:AcrR family transcriptional regulator
MSKGDETRRRVLVQAGGLMNRTGYLATPLSAILDEVGLQKGGLYNHFASKEALGLEAFSQNASTLGDYLGRLSRAPGDPAEVLWSLTEASLDVAAGLIVPGGCPVLNAGIEADDTSEPLREAASRSAEALRRYFLLPLHRLERAGRLKAGTDCDALSYLFVAAVEGAILWQRVTRDATGQPAALSMLRALVSSLLLS